VIRNLFSLPITGRLSPLSFVKYYAVDRRRLASTVCQTLRRRAQL